MSPRGPDGLPLRAIKAFARAWFIVALKVRRREVFKRWVLAGECNQCAVCCERPSMMVDWAIWNVKPIRRLFLWWQRAVNGFELVAEEQPRTFAFRCHYFDTQKRVCTSYESRPGMCRDYPRLLLEQSDPTFYKECGYRAVASNSKSLLRIVERSPLSDAERAEMKRKLRLE